MPTAADFERELLRIFADATRRGQAWVEVEAGALHRAVGGYPGQNHRMPVCCGVMYRHQRAGDTLLHAPPKGKGATLRIRYTLPR